MLNYSKPVNKNYIIFQAMSLMESYICETDYTVWCCVMNCLIKLWEMLTNTKVLDKFNAYARKLMDGIRFKVSWDITSNANPSEKFMTNLILSSLVTFGDKDAIDEGYKRLVCIYIIIKVNINCINTDFSNTSKVLRKWCLIYGLLVFMRL